MLNCTESRGEIINSDEVLVKANAITTAFISGCGIIGNLLIITAFCSKKSLQNVTNIFLVQLACVDFTKAVFILIPKVYTQLLEQCDIVPVYCPISGFISTISFVHSALLLAAIGVVRYVKMIHSTSFDRIFATRKLVCYCLFLAIQTISLGVVPFFGGGEYKYSPYHGVCFTDWSNENKGFRITFYVYTIGICYLTILFSYTRIYMKLRAHNSVTLVNLGSSKSLSNAKCNETMPRQEAVPGGKKGSYRVREEVFFIKTPSDLISHSSRSNGIKELTDVVLQERPCVTRLTDDDAVDDNDSNDFVINDGDDPKNDDENNAYVSGDEGNNDDVSSDGVNSDGVIKDKVNDDGDMDGEDDDKDDNDDDNDDDDDDDDNDDNDDDDDDDDDDNDDNDDEDDDDDNDDVGIGKDSSTSKGEPQEIRSGVKEERPKIALNSEKLGEKTSSMSNSAKRMKAKKKRPKREIRGCRLFLSEIKVTKIMFVIVIAYTLCWVPAFIINVYMFAQLRSNETGNTKEIAPEVLYLIITLVDLKVFINPMIYGIMNTQFRKTIRALILKVLQI